MRRWWPPAAWAALILTVSSIPSSELPSTGVSDKLQHAGAYFVLAFLVARAPRHAPGLKAVAVMLLSIAAFGAIDEWHQRFIPGRVPDPLDWVADMAGTIGALAITAIARNAFRNDDSRVQVT